MIEWLHRHGVTRDSLGWLWLKVAAAAGLVINGTINPATLGLSEGQSRAVMAACAVIAYLSGQMSTSPLPGKRPS